ncbi:MAG: UdgX family uracil-DNA binding protein [Caulobacteraceae bacterium]|nr:UdgX family uracil-DNA binding protein [Caulobacteraceae bacterium]
MKTVRLAHETDFAGWRDGARALVNAGVLPGEARFGVGCNDNGLFDEPLSAVGGPAIVVPRRFLELAQEVVLHRTADRFDLLYRLLWRMRERPDLLHVDSDADVADALERARNVSRASHKMKAFVRFREVEDDAGEAYVSWFEPAHRVVEKTAPFFVRRFTTMRWSILTPDLSAIWDGERLVYAPGASRQDAPGDDRLEDFWRAYYASIFNPARLKARTMQGEMPKRYWRNLPEAVLIPSLIAQAGRRTEDMRASPASESRKQTARAVARPARASSPHEGKVLDDLAELRPALQGCRRCDLWRHATQGVAGEGPRRADLMLVGEQPGDQEDLAGQPFVGPAGKLLDRALQAAGVDRENAYVTNAVKHFKFEPRGKRRLHQSPDAGEIGACRWWYEQELALVKPKVVVALGATAARQVLGRPVSLMKERGSPIDLGGGVTALLSIHPSFALRTPGEAEKARVVALLEGDLRMAAKLVG